MAFEREGRTVSLRVKGRLTFTVNEGATAAAVAGLGIVSTGLWGCRAELASGTLVRILGGLDMPSQEIQRPISRRARGEAIGAGFRRFPDRRPQGVGEPSPSALRAG